MSSTNFNPEFNFEGKENSGKKKSGFMESNMIQLVLGYTAIAIVIGCLIRFFIANERRLIPVVDSGYEMVRDFMYFPEKAPKRGTEAASEDSLKKAEQEKIKKRKPRPKKPNTSSNFFYDKNLPSKVLPITNTVSEEKIVNAIKDIGIPADTLPNLLNDELFLSKNLLYPYLVRPGDLIDSVASIHKMTVEELLNLNPFLKRNPRLTANKTLLRLRPWKMHLIEKGHILSRVAEIHGITLVNLMSVNNLKEDYANRGDWLIIPYP